MSSPLAYLLTWNCYGAWLPGDPRGTVDIRHNIPGRPTAPPNEWRRRANASRLVNAPIHLDRQREIVARTIDDHCVIRGWERFAANIRTNHVHIVVACGEYHPDIARDQFKAWATRCLREAGHFPKPTVVWAEDGSSRYLWDADQVRDAVR